MSESQKSIPNQRWRLHGKDGVDALHLEQDSFVPKLGEHEVLLEIQAVSLNYRDIAMISGQYPMASIDPLVPVSDAAGIVKAVGPKVTRFKPGDDALPIFTQSALFGDVQDKDRATGLGGLIDGVLQKVAVFDEQSLVHMPSNCDHQQGATLPCAAVTAWNALFGLEGKRLAPAQWVLTQGTGGVSLFAVQFAKAAGARVVATTSSDEKANLLKTLGADHVINYKKDESWGETARMFTGGIGFHHVVDVGGNGTLGQAMKAVRRHGVVSVIGFLGNGQQPGPSVLDALMRGCIIRGIAVGSRDMLEAVVDLVEAQDIKPVIAETVFKFEEVKEAYKYMAKQGHTGKVVIQVA
ncbi:hypothetical protein IAR55_002203 [Kwoniella newhampshirensis]|uniref:Enoyl reductase (ER) domain-containing protein n=1 Tax=Kwoniella newhampshirensis TaxID=1651941 RepID=A0AAW0YS49_9TREE